MLGIEDGWIAAAFLLCLASAVLCVVYGLIRYNRDEEPLAEEDVHWAQEEQRVEEEL